MADFFEPGYTYRDGIRRAFRADREITPSACRHCGIPEREHCQQWNQSVGWHRWESPTGQQILARMRMRRALRS